MGDTALKGSTIATSYDWLVFRGDTFSATGNKINLMNDSGVIQASNFYIDTTNDRIGIGIDSPQKLLHLRGADTGIYLTPTENTIEDGDQLGNVYFGGYDTDDGWKVGAQIRGEASASWGSHANDAPTELQFWTSPDGDDAIAQRMVINRTGYVGIGTSSPASMLEIHDTSGAGLGVIRIDGESVSTSRDSETALIMSPGGSGYDAKIYANGTNGEYGKDPYMRFALYNDALGGVVDVMTLESGGNVGIGTTDPDVKLEIRGEGTSSSTSTLKCTASDDDVGLLVRDDGAILMPQYADGSVTFSGGTGLVTTSSDERMKKDIETITIDGLSKVNALNPVTYKWREKDTINGDDVTMYDSDGTAPNDGVEMGFIAQEVAEIIPQASPDYGDDRKRGLYNRPIIAVLVKAVQELSAKVEALENA